MHYFLSGFSRNAVCASTTFNHISLVFKRGILSLYAFYYLVGVFTFLQLRIYKTESPVVRYFTLMNNSAFSFVPVHRNYCCVIKSSLSFAQFARAIVETGHNLLERPLAPVLYEIVYAHRKRQCRVCD